MTKFIMLSQSVGNAGKSVSLIINVDTIDTIELSNKGTDTRVLKKDGKFFFVKETLDDVWNKIHLDYSNQPVIMTSDGYKTYTQLKNGR